MKKEHTTGALVFALLVLFTGMFSVNEKLLGSAATTAAAISDFFIDQSPKFLESIDSLHAVATPRAWLLPIPGLKSKSFSPKSRGTQSSARSGGPKSAKPVVCQQQAPAGGLSLRSATPAGSRRRPGELAPQWQSGALMQTHIRSGRGELRRPAAALERLCCAMDSALRTLATPTPAARPAALEAARAVGPLV